MKNPTNKVAFQANIPSELNAQLNELKAKLGLTNSELLQALASFKQNPFRSDLSTNQKLELEIEQALKGTNKITAYSLRMVWGKNKVSALNVAKVMELYSTEIEEHNAKFSE